MKDGLGWFDLNLLLHSYICLRSSAVQYHYDDNHETSWGAHRDGDTVVLLLLDLGAVGNLLFLGNDGSSTR